MFLLLSPSKTINISEKRKGLASSIPFFINEAKTLVNILKQYNVSQLAALMATSQKLSQLTFDRYQFWNPEHIEFNSCQAILGFRGDVFSGIDAISLSNDDLNFLNEHLIVLSGLYGMLHPLDLIQPYRLEVAHKLDVKGQGNLYNFWVDMITKAVNQLVKGDVLVNLASNEYFRMLNLSGISAEVITPVFKEYTNGKYKIVSIYAKRARGLMTRFITEKRISNPEDMKFFDSEGYFYNDEQSDSKNFVFTRG